MNYEDIEKAWKQRIAQKTADYEGEIVATTLQANAEIERLNSEIERLKHELVEARGTQADATEAPTTS